jgi:ethanolaminephosphotransferase
MAMQTLFVTAGTVGVMIACMLLRQHLFVWTVFSPKYLYSGAWAVGAHLGARVCLGAGLYWLGGGWSRSMEVAA